MAFYFIVGIFPIGAVTANVTVLSKGDVNADALIDSLDAVCVLQYDAGLAELNEKQLIASDCNSDGSSDSLDAVHILRYDAGLSDDVTKPGTLLISPSKKIYDVPIIGMLPKYQCGCEGVSAVMLLNYYGIDIDCDYFFGNALDTFPFTYAWQTNTYYGEDMDRFYVGDPSHEFGKGCFAPVIKTAIEKIVPDDYIAVVEQGGTVEKLVDKYLKKKGQPILLWATSYMRDSFDGTVWRINRTNGAFTFPAYMHCMVLVGYDDVRDYYYFNDPLEGKVVAYNKRLVEKKFKELGSQALALIKTDEYKADHTAIVDGKVYAIRNAATGKYITALDSQSTNGANIIQDVLDKTSAQSFIAKKHADGSFSFVNKETGKALDIMNAGGSVKSGCNVQLYTYNKSSVQRFTVYKAENGFFKLCCENVPSIALSVYGNYNGDNGKSPTSFGNVYMNSATDDDLYQMWEFVPLN